MLDPTIENYVLRNTLAPTLQTTCQLPKTLRQFAQDFQRDSQSGMFSSRSKDGLSYIDQLVTQALAITATDHIRTAYVAKLLVTALYSWCRGRDPKTQAPISTDSRGRRNTAIQTFLAGAYICYKYCNEAATSGPAALGLFNRKADIPLNLYQYRFSRTGFRISQAPARLYRGDTRPPAMLWAAGGFYPKMEQVPKHDPHLGGGASQQVISTTTDDQLVTRFAWHNRVYCPVRFYYIHHGDTPRAVAGFIYEIDKQGQQCVEVAGVTPGREMAFLAIPNQFIRRFKMRYYAGSQNNIVTSDWMYYNSNSVQNIRIAEDKNAWEQLKRNYHAHV